MMKEKTIVTLTSYGKRLGNLPIVLDTIFNQTEQPDLVVLNLAFGESVPEDVVEYLNQHDVEVNRVPDTKVYKKLIPTLKRYPEACVISIDDDFLYPQGMIEEFVRIHERCPDHPISGNRVVCFGMQCHCGCASLTKAIYLGDYLHQIDERIISSCPSDDMLYSYFATKSGHPYIQTENEYFINMPGYNCSNDQGYSSIIDRDGGIFATYDYLVKQFGEVDEIIPAYIRDDHIAKMIETLCKHRIWEIENVIRSSNAYRLGKFLLKPFSWLKNNRR